MIWEMSDVMAEFEHPGDGKLADTLAGIIGELRLRGYCSIQWKLDDALLGDCDLFVKQVSEHLRQEDDILLPSLLQADPSSQAEIDDYRKDHRSLSQYAKELTQHIQANDDQNACRVARDFLALMMDHMARESKTVNRILESMGPEESGRLLARISGKSRNSRCRC